MQPPVLSNMQEHQPRAMPATSGGHKMPPTSAAAVAAGTPPTSAAAAAAAAVAAGTGGVSAPVRCLVAQELALLRCLSRISEGAALRAGDVAEEYKNITGRQLPCDNAQLLAQWGAIYISPGAGPDASLKLLTPAVVDQHLARLTALGLPAAVQGVAEAAPADNEGDVTVLDLQAPGTWAHLGQEAALEAALLVSLYIAAHKSHLLSTLGRGVEVTFQHMTQRPVDCIVAGQRLTIDQLLVELFGGLYLAPHLPLAPRLYSSALRRQLWHVAARKVVLDAAAGVGGAAPPAASARVPAAAAATPAAEPAAASVPCVPAAVGSCVSPGALHGPAQLGACGPLQQQQQQQGHKRSRQHTLEPCTSETPSSCDGVSVYQLPAPRAVAASSQAAAAAGDAGAADADMRTGHPGDQDMAGSTQQQQQQQQQQQPQQQQEQHRGPSSPATDTHGAVDGATTQLPHGRDTPGPGDGSSPPAAHAARKRPRERKVPAPSGQGTHPSAAAVAARRGQSPPASKSRHRDTDASSSKRDQRKQQHALDEQSQEDYWALQQELLSQQDAARWAARRAAGYRYTRRDDRRDQAAKKYTWRAPEDVGARYRRRSRSSSRSSSGDDSWRTRRQLRTSAAAAAAAAAAGGERWRSRQQVGTCRSTTGEDARRGARPSSRRLSSDGDDRRPSSAEAARRRQSPRRQEKAQRSGSARAGSPSSHRAAAGELSDGEISPPRAADLMAATGVAPGMRRSAAQPAATPAPTSATQAAAEAARSNERELPLVGVPSGCIQPAGPAGAMYNSSGSGGSNSKPHRPMRRLVPATAGTHAAGGGRFGSSGGRGAAFRPSTWQQRMPRMVRELQPQAASLPRLPELEAGQAAAGSAAVHAGRSSSVQDMPSTTVSQAVSLDAKDCPHQDQLPELLEVLEVLGNSSQPAQGPQERKPPAASAMPCSGGEEYDPDEIWKQIF